MSQVVSRKNLSLKEAAEWCGISERTLRRRIAEGNLPAYRLGPRYIRVRSEDIEALLRPIPSAATGTRRGGRHDAA